MGGRCIRVFLGVQKKNNIYIYIWIYIYEYIYIYIYVFCIPLEYIIIEILSIPTCIRLFVFLPSICFALFLSGLEGSRFEIPWLAGTHATAYAMSPPAGREKVELELSHLSSRGFACWKSIVNLLEAKWWWEMTTLFLGEELATCQCCLQHIGSYFRAPHPSSCGSLKKKQDGWQRHDMRTGASARWQFWPKNSRQNVQAWLLRVQHNYQRLNHRKHVFNAIHYYYARTGDPANRQSRTKIQTWVPMLLKTLSLFRQTCFGGRFFCHRWNIDEMLHFFLKDQLFVTVVTVSPFNITEKIHGSSPSPRFNTSRLNTMGNTSGLIEPKRREGRVVSKR